MSAPTETNKTTASSNVPESPTTARPLDLDDDDVQETGIMTEDKSADNPASAAAGATAPLGPGPGPGPDATSETAPPKPPRPMTEAQKNELILKEAFPSIEQSIIKAVLSASRGHIEPAFQALLEMTDPDAAREVQVDEPPPPQPPRPTSGSREMSQLEADELYARQLAEHYENTGAYEERTSNREHGQHRPQRRQQTGLRPDQMHDDREHSFLDDELPAIRENLRKGFMETQTKVNSWITTLKKKVDEAFDEDEEARQSHLAYGRKPGEPSRRSGDYDRYDADPQVITDDFAGMKLSSDGTPLRDGRPLANPNLYKPPPPSKSPKPGDGRKVAFKDSTEDIDMYQASPKLSGRDGAPSSGAKPSKWQPLSTVDPSPIADNDPFSLGDSEDEKDAKDKASKEIKMEDSERLRKAAAEAMADSLVDSKPQGEASGAKKS